MNSDFRLIPLFVMVTCVTPIRSSCPVTLTDCSMGPFLVVRSDCSVHKRECLLVGKRRESITKKCTARKRYQTRVIVGWKKQRLRRRQCVAPSHAMIHFISMMVQAPFNISFHAFDSFQHLQYALSPIVQTPFWLQNSSNYERKQ